MQPICNIRSKKCGRTGHFTGTERHIRRLYGAFLRERNRNIADLRIADHNRAPVWPVWRPKLLAKSICGKKREAWDEHSFENGSFAIVPLSMGILGFMGAGTGYQAQNLGIINFELIRHFFPSWAVLPFLFMIVSGLLSTVDSNLCAVSSLTTDIAGGKDIRKTRTAMVILLILGILIANIPGITVTHLFLFYGIVASVYIIADSADT